MRPGRSELGVFRHASISGRVFDDHNGNGVRDANEAVRVGTPVFLDLNGNQIRDFGEPSTSSDAEGFYSLDRLGRGVVYAAPGTPVQLFSTTTKTGNPYVTESGIDQTIGVDV